VSAAVVKKSSVIYSQTHDLEALEWKRETGWDGRLKELMKL
jgi:hypothetical protein